MRKVLKKFKDTMFFKLVEKNPNILEAYQNYKWSVTGRENKLKSWSFIALLNIQYRVLKIDQASRFNRQRKRKAVISGPESQVAKRSAPEQFVKQLLTYDVISFDVFDTLILRPFAKPFHLFMLLAEKHDHIGFMTIRRKAEKAAREKALVNKGNREVTIYDIYEIIEEQTGIDKEYGAKVEFETELEHCFANPYMHEVYRILKSHGKKIIAVSDMYLTKEMIQTLLKKNGYYMDGVYVSSEWNGSKRDKNLYKVVLNTLDPTETTRIIHVGDNYTTDIVAAREMGIDAKYYKNVHEAGSKYRPTNMSDLVGSVYKGLVNTRIHNGKFKYSVPYEFGYIYGGIYVLGYCCWIHNYAKNNNIDKVLFLARDGYIYRRVFNDLFDDVSNEYVYWSRIANMKYTIEKNKEDFLNRAVRQKASNTIRGTFETSIRSHLMSLELGNMLDLLPKYGLHEEDIIHNGNVNILERLIIENWDYVIKQYSQYDEIVKEYFLNIIGDSKNIAVVDVGWLGSSGMGIKYLIEEKWKLGCNVRSLVAASWRANHAKNLHKIMNEETEAYMFSRTFNRQLYNIHGSNNGLNCIFFELFTQAPHPSFAGFKKNPDGSLDYVFDVPEIENYEIINGIHKGIIDFVTDYKRVASKSKILLNISGHDAYMPFSVIIRDLRYFEKHFGNMLFSRGVLANYEKQTMESLRFILTKAGIKNGGK